MTTSFKNQSAQRPTAMGTLLQSSAYGATIPNGYGMTQSPLLAIWAANLRQGGGNTKKFKQMKKGITNYCECIDFLLGHNPIMGVLQVINNGSNLPLNFTSQSFASAGGRQSFTVADSHFYFVIAVTLEANYELPVNDYGGQGPSTLSGTYEIPLWNELETGPDPTDSTAYRCWPYCYRWQPGFGATIQIDSESFPAGTLKIYYAQLMEATSYEPPVQKLKLAFEPQLGSGGEYSEASLASQQIIYPHFAGLGSSEIDLGSSGALPSLNPEVRFKWGVYPTGDADFVDMIEDIYKSGLAQAAIAAETSDLPTPAATQMERGLSSYDLPGCIQKKFDAHATVALPPMLYNLPNTAGNCLVVVVTGGGALAISSSAGESWTPVYVSGLGYQVWYAEAKGGANIVTVSGATAPWSMAIFEIGGTGGSVKNAVMVYPTTNANSNSGTGVSASTDTTCSLQISGTHGGVTLADRGTADASWGGFVWPGLPSGAVVTSIEPVIKYDYKAPGVGSYFFGGPYGFPSVTSSGTWIGASLGTSPSNLTSWAPAFELLYSGDGDIYTASLVVTSIGLEVSYSIPTGGLGGEIVDIVATSSNGAASVASSLVDGLPGYLMAISLYPSGGAPAVADKPKWNAVTPANFYANSPASFQVQDRIIRSPGTYKAAGAGSTPASICLIALKAPQPVAYPKPLGDFIDVPSFDLVRAQCRANGLWGSLSMTSQSAASEWINTLCQAANCAPVFLGAKLYLYPYSEVSAAGNGATYIAPTAAGPVADLDADNGDFVGSDGCPKLTTADRVGSPNVLQMQCIDRNDNYNQVTVQTPNPAGTALYGVRKGDAAVNNAVQDPTIARTLLGIQVRRNVYGGDTWTFTASPRWMLLSPMDLVTLTDRLQGIVKVPVRIVSYDEQQDGSFEATAEPFIYGMCAPTALAAVSPSSNPTSVNASAGDVNLPLIFEPVPRLCAEAPQAQLWAVLSSAASNYGGCQAYVSTDGGSSYNPVGDPLIGSAITGVLTAEWPAAADPDTSDDLTVDLTESNGVLESYAVTDEDKFVYPCFVQGSPIDVSNNGALEAAIPLTAILSDGNLVVGNFGYELMAYATAALTAANKYTLKATGSGNHLRRAVFNAPAASEGCDHPVGARWAFLSPAGTGILKINMDPVWVGHQLFFKFCSFNSFGAAAQSLADVQAYSYNPTGVPYL